MNTKRRVSCSKIFLYLRRIWQQLSRRGWVADGQQNSPAEDSAIWPPSREADLRAEQLASRADRIQCRSEISSGLSRIDNFCPPRPSREADHAPSGSHQEQ